MGYHVGVLVLINDASVFELDVEVLINGMQCPSDGQIVLQLYGYFSSHQILEEVSELKDVDAIMNNEWHDPEGTVLRSKPRNNANATVA
ncbi:uncharacterized protein HKW66_Vig0050280 [Vigna angularis]|uniref:Uncharacterized protein n=1 Tax=Phaseolus angularis TaxID=3914 RepID=A0A8T0L628_PHAAN|nr:uncharacterized protein HKW66_Vig0050280 [Vigna angularis]